LSGRLILLYLTLAALFSLIVVGAYVAAAGYGGACGTDVPQDWPGCLGGLLPPPLWGPVVEYTHRVLAAVSTLLLFLTTFAFWRAGPSEGRARRTLLASSLLLVVQVLLGGAVVAQDLAPALVAAHQALAVLILGLTTFALAISRPPVNGFNSKPG